MTDPAAVENQLKEAAISALMSGTTSELLLAAAAAIKSLYEQNTLYAEELAILRSPHRHKGEQPVVYLELSDAAYNELIDKLRTLGWDDVVCRLGGKMMHLQGVAVARADVLIDSPMGLVPPYPRDVIGQ